MRFKTVSALEIKNGNVVYIEGYRVRVSGFRLVEGSLAVFNLHSEPNAAHPDRLPVGYEGMNSSGNKSRRIRVEMTVDEAKAANLRDMAFVDSHEADYSTIPNQRS